MCVCAAPHMTRGLCRRRKLGNVKAGSGKLSGMRESGLSDTHTSCPESRRKGPQRQQHGDCQNGPRRPHGTAPPRGGGRGSPSALYRPLRALWCGATSCIETRRSLSRREPTSISVFTTPLVQHGERKMCRCPPPLPPLSGITSLWTPAVRSVAATLAAAPWDLAIPRCATIQMVAAIPWPHGPRRRHRLRHAYFLRRTHGLRRPHGWRPSQA